MGSRTCASSSRLPTRRSTGPNAPGRTRPSGRASLLTAMGLLDDAIREHLELKRRHGADPQEVARQEDEALGTIGDHESHDDEHEQHGDDEDDAVHEVHAHQQELDLPPVAEEPVEEPAHAFEPAEHHERDEPAEPEDSHQPTIEYS